MNDQFGFPINIIYFSLLIGCEKNIWLYTPMICIDSSASLMKLPITFFFICKSTVRAGNEPSYSGSARKKLGFGSARELNEPSLSLNLGLINLGLDSGSARARLEKARLGPPGPIRRWNEASAYGLWPTGFGLHRCDSDSSAPE